MNALTPLLGRGPFRWIAGSIRNKLLVAMSVLSLVPLVGLSVATYFLATDALKARGLGHFEAVARAKAARLVALHEKNVLILGYAARERFLRDRLQQLQE